MRKLIPILLIIVFLQMSCFNIISFAVQETVENELQENAIEEDKPSPTSEIEAPTEEPEDIEAEKSEAPSLEVENEVEKAKKKFKNDKTKIINSLLRKGFNYEDIKLLFKD